MTLGSTVTTKTPKPVIVPFTVLVDNNEQLPYFFRGLTADADKKYRPLEVARKVVSLNTGDYSIEGIESQVAVERKSKADLYQTLANGRDRFSAELERMNHMQAACVMVEEEWSTLLVNPSSGMNPKCVFRTILAYQIRYPRVGWNLVPGRWAAELTTFRYLEKFWQEQEKRVGR